MITALLLYASIGIVFGIKLHIQNPHIPWLMAPISIGLWPIPAYVLFRMKWSSK